MKSDLEKIGAALSQPVALAEHVYRGKSGARCYKVTAPEGTFIAKLFPEKPTMLPLTGQSCP